MKAVSALLTSPTPTISAEVLESLLRYDSDAVWMVQAWWSNPTNDLLKGMGESAGSCYDP